MCNLMYHIAYNNKQQFVAECCFICSTNLSVSWHHSLQGECCSSISAGSDTIPRWGSTPSVDWLERGGWRDVAQSNSKSEAKSVSNSSVLHELKRSKRTFPLLHIRNTISEAADINEGAACSTVLIYTSLVV